MIKRRYGIVHISDELLKDGEFVNYTKHFMVLEATHEYHSNSFKYIFYNECLPVVDVGAEIPKYVVEVKTDCPDELSFINLSTQMKYKSRVK